MNDQLHSVLHTAGIQATRLIPLWRFMLLVSIVVFVLVAGAFLWALLRRRARDSEPAEQKLLRVIAGAGGVTILTLLVFLVVDYRVGRAATGTPRPALVVNVVGHQWWWEVEYDDSLPARHVRTANEIHVPVGRPVLLRLEAADVIHSLWVPSLAGKKDLVPGHINSMWFEADTPGVYRGQCAEFCGHQHAKMALLVIAEPPDQFAAWYRRELEPAANPGDSHGQHGLHVFLGSSCAMCHSIDGTPAGSREGPPLTHIASRRTIAAATLANTRSNLASWIVDPQAIKPGSHMPPNELSPADLDALVSYLGELK